MIVRIILVLLAAVTLAVPGAVLAQQFVGSLLASYPSYSSQRCHTFQVDR